MIIDLPKELSLYNSENPKERVAWIENGVLKIKRSYSFRKAMIEISYIIKGKKRCCYCKQKIAKDEKITIDHMYPRDVGGPTITNNLLPSCNKCNIEKANMTTEQYKAFKNARSKGKAKEFREDLEGFQNYIRKWKGYQIPDEWISKRNFKDIIANFDLTEDYKGKSYKSLEKYYLQYGIIQKPIVIDRRSFLLDGFLCLMLAKNYNIDMVPVIVLDNVEIEI